MTYMIDPSILSAIIGVAGSAIIALAIGFFGLYRKVEINDERLSKLGLEKNDLHEELKDIKATVYEIRDAMLRENKL